MLVKMVTKSTQPAIHAYIPPHLLNTHSMLVSNEDKRLNKVNKMIALSTDTNLRSSIYIFSKCHLPKYWIVFLKDIEYWITERIACYTMVIVKDKKSLIWEISLL